MSARSELLFAAQKRIMNPFLLCAVTSARARQLMMAANGQATLAELLDSVLSEVASGALEFQVEGPGYSSAVPTVEDTNVVPALGQAEKTEERISVSPARLVTSAVMSEGYEDV